MEWIKVEDRLPENNNFVIAVFETLYIGSKAIDVAPTRYQHGRFLNEMDRTRVTHWTPLPAPPPA